MKPIVDISIPGSSWLAEQQSSYDDVLHRLLQEAGLGEVVGGGSPADGCESCDIEVQVTHLEDALLLLRNELCCLKAPEGTKLLYIDDGQEVEERLGAQGWALRSLSPCQAIA